MAVNNYIRSGILTVSELVMGFNKRILFVTATRREAVGAGILAESSSREGVEHVPLAFKGVDAHLLVTGVGMTATAFALGKHLALNSYDLVINLGIAGSLHPDLALAEVVNVIDDCFADLGAEDNGQFLSIQQMGLIQPNDKPFIDGRVKSNLDKRMIPSDLRNVSGITVNKVTGSAESIALCKSVYPHAAIESMEGAAFFYSCLLSGLPCMQLRAISNVVEPRNRNNWKIPEALDSLARVVQNWIPLLQNV
jgi:futalosine hydrolase